MAAKNELNQFFAISKIDEDLQMVWGYASTEAKDAQGETVTKAAMEAAWDEYMQFGNIREMHQASAVGVVKEYAFDDVGVQIGVKVVDDQAWKKVVEGVYKGFSIGGKKLVGGYDAITKTITALKLTEISLVDRPANPEALITVWKADLLENEPMTKKTKAETEGSVDALADLLSKGTISPERLLALANEDILKVSTPETPATEVAPVEQGSTDVPVDTSVETAKVDVPVDVTVEVEPVAKGNTELRKSLGLLTVVGEDVRKGMYSVSWFADLIQSLTWLQQDCAWEAEYEVDNSPVPVKLAALISQLAGVLLEMAKEEVAELVATLKIPEGTDPLAALSMIVANSETGKDYQKFNEAWDILKAGSRNNAADTTRIQKAHDIMSELGAICKGDDIEAGDLAVTLSKATEAGDIAKALAGFEKMSNDFATLQKSFTTLSEEHTTLKKAFNAAPSVPKGALSTIEKSADVLTELTTEGDVAPVLKADGTVDLVATEIKKVHAGGGRQMAFMKGPQANA